MATRPNAMRNYPPLALLALVGIIVLAVMPSSLNLPQSNPSETLEYAPVPPDDEAPPQQSGNLASLGVASSSGPAGEGTGGGSGGGGGQTPSDQPTDPPPPGVGTSPSSMRCVGNPPRQTEDPLSPPCVAFFEGDNFGETYPGVTREEIKVVIYQPGGGTYCNYGDDGCPSVPLDRLYDLAEAPEEDEFYHLAFYRNWQRYFNERYQTYGRFVHFYVYYNNGATTPETRRADAATLYSKIGPFASLDYVYGNADAFVDSMARRGVMNFGGRDLRVNAAYQRHPGLIWSFAPSVERMATSFSSLLCTKLKDYPASFSGNAGDNGRQRVLGFVRTTDALFPQYLALAKLVREQAESCGIRFEAEATYPLCFNRTPAQSNRDEALSMAQFRNAGVTTVIWVGCWEGNMTPAAASVNYYPEWVTTDYRGFERSEMGAVVQDQREWANAWVVTPQTFQNADGIPVEPSCLEAYLSVDPDVDRDSLDLNIACRPYVDLRQLFTGIQVAGPRLGPKSIERGFRAIPPKPSPDRNQVSCYYDLDDYTCNKDAVAQWWDPTAAGANSRSATPLKGIPGCYRMGDDGRRYRAGEWPPGDLATMKRPDQICNLSNEQ